MQGNPNPRTDQLTPWGPDNPPPKSPGRPRKRELSQAYEEWLRTSLPPEVIEEGARQGVKLKSNADTIAVALGQKARKGDVLAAKELREATEGKATQRVELVSAEDRGFELRVIHEDPPLREKILNAVNEAAVTQAVREDEPEETAKDTDQT